MASIRELMSLASDGWTYSGLAQDDNQLHASSRPRRRRSSQKTNVAQHDHLLPSSPLSSAPPQSPAEPTPPTSVPSSRTSFSVDHDSNESELSSVPEDVSDYSDEERTPKKRRLDVPAARPTRIRRPSQKVVANRAAEANKKPRRRSTTTVLKLDGKKLQQFDTNSGSGEPASPLPSIATAPDSAQAQAQEEQGTLLPSLPSTPKPEAQLQEPPSPIVTATKSETSTPGDRDLHVDPTFQVSEKPPPRSSRKRGRPKKTDCSSPQILSPDSVCTDETGGQAIISDPIARELEPLVEVSRQLMNLSSGCPVEAKPSPVGQPEVWAEGRQALCESLPYYRSYQGAGYCTNGSAYSFMFDKEGWPRDYMDSEVVIARSGGGLSKEQGSGKMIQKKDQTEGSQIRSVQKSKDQYSPVVVLSGNGNLQCPSKLTHAYNVLDWFKPTHIWAEKFNGKVNFRYRFEKLFLDKQSWWAGGPEPTSVKAQASPHVQTCSHCQQTNQQVYLQGWMCLQPDCPRFWRLESGHEPQEAGLLYDPRFLKQYTAWPHASAPQPLRPDCLALGPTPMLGDDVQWAAAKGLVCPQCGRCNSREAWEGWRCGNPACSFTYSLPRANVPVNALHDPYNPLSSGYALSKDLCPSPHISLSVTFAHNYRINRFAIPGVDGGFIAHFIANKTVNEEAGGPDDMWTELQTAPDLGLRRRPLDNSTLSGPMLTQHFAVNYGMPYKFIAATASRPFAGAARPIAATRSRLNWAARHCLGRDPNSGEAVHAKEKEFNELLALGYFEGQKISYHDDGEHGLGPTIATLSVGTPATMKLRMKAKHHAGVSKGGAYVDAAPAPGCKKYEERRAAHAQLEALRERRAEAGGEEGKEAARAYRERVKALPKELGLRANGMAEAALEMHLGHGDIVVMHGAKIQEYYEHKVEPIGKLRFALTCRYIDPTTLKDEDQPEYEVEPDIGDYDGSRLPAVPA